MTERRESYETYADAIAAIARTIRNSDWASDVRTKCALIEDELYRLRRLALEVEEGGGER